MEWIEEVVPYIAWTVVMVMVLAPTPKTKKIKELERRVEELEKLQMEMRKEK